MGPKETATCDPSRPVPRTFPSGGAESVSVSRCRARCRPVCSPCSVRFERGTAGSPVGLRRAGQRGLSSPHTSGGVKRARTRCVSLTDPDPSVGQSSDERGDQSRHRFWSLQGHEVGGVDPVDADRRPGAGEDGQSVGDLACHPSTEFVEPPHAGRGRWSSVGLHQQQRPVDPVQPRGDTQCAEPVEFVEDLQRLGPFRQRLPLAVGQGAYGREGGGLRTVGLPASGFRLPGGALVISASTVRGQVNVEAGPSSPPEARLRGIGFGVLSGGLTAVVSIVLVRRAWSACGIGSGSAANVMTLLFLAPLIGRAGPCLIPSPAGPKRVPWCDPDA